MSGVIVRTKEELKLAIKNEITNIIIEGDLAKNVHKSKEIKKLGGVALGVLTTSLVVATATAPITGGISYIVAAPIATGAGLPVNNNSFINCWNKCYDSISKGL